MSPLISRGLCVSLLVALCCSQPAAAKSKVPGWGIVVIIVGSIALIAAIFIPIVCCCTCHACEKEEDLELPTEYPQKDNVHLYYNEDTP